ncbi:hypothetical protein I551_4722 [Mycobacterium ulcerans str. Harvey]|uniref:Uncharacterized protein n=1 Tax=Mycobacterium ulcerans str. Harvey TaxID=1299332 RepID=A0ABN0QVX6_MYCUL|nr:hypothetical protein I551_4722 [Mycobacterium ulcerans str. Harvey]
MIERAPSAGRDGEPQPTTQTSSADTMPASIPTRVTGQT